MSDPDDIRKTAIEFAQRYIGYDADPADPESRMNYLDLIAPGEDEEKRRAMIDESGCGLVVAGIWRALGVQSPLLDPPYRSGSGLSRLFQIAHAAQALVAFKEGELPSPGDVVLVGAPGTHEVQHVYTVISISTDNGVVSLESVDGGQRDDGHFETISTKRRRWRGNQDVVVQGNDPGAGTSRTIQCWFDVTKLPGVGE